MPLHADVAATETNFNVKATISRNRFKGIVALAEGYRVKYIGAIVMLGYFGNCEYSKSVAYCVTSLIHLLNPIMRTSANFPDSLIAMAALAFVGLSGDARCICFFQWRMGG